MQKAPDHHLPPDIERRLLFAKSLLEKGDLDQAETELQRTLEQAPGNRTIRNLLGEVFLRQGNWGEIRKEMERRMIGRTGPAAETDQACLKLRFGDMPQGWLHYESRWRIPEFAAQEQRYSEPRWEGEPFPGKTLLIYWEQGFGDTLMFIRYLPMVKALGGRVILAAQAQLADLAATCPGADQVIAHGEPLPAFDLQCPLLSLPSVFRTDLASIPAEIPYLDVPGRVPNRGAIADALSHSRDQTRVGLVWAGSPTHKNTSRRDIPAPVLAALQALPGVAWFSFQVGKSEPLPFPGIAPLEKLLDNFSDTAYALSAMDLLITVDTAVAHLAGAMGIPTLLLLSALPDWRWLMGREDSPWYPTMRLYRQAAPGNWEEVVHHLLGDLAG